MLDTFRLLASTPGHSFRYEATETLLDAQRQTGQFDEIIEFFVALACDTYGSYQERAIARLAAFHETEQIEPVLSRMSVSADAASQYRIARALVLGGMSEVPFTENIDAILARRAGSLSKKKALSGATEEAIFP